jgi:hypothetical protein
MQHGAGVLSAAPLVYVGNVIARTLVIHVCRAQVLFGITMQTLRKNFIEVIVVLFKCHRTPRC